MQTENFKKCHKSAKLDSYLGKNVKVTFHGGHWCQGILTMHKWRYGMDNCDWHSASGKVDSHFCQFSFCHSHVKTVEEVLDSDT